MNVNVIDCIPSRTLRKYLEANPVEMSALRQATIVYNYAKKKNRLPLFRQLLEEADNEAEKLFLRSAVKDAREGLEYYSDETEKIYDEKFPHDGPPCFPFYEVCGLPVLFKRGDVIRWHKKHGWHKKGNKLFYVGFLPFLIPGHCDFSDEDYLVFPLSLPVETEDELMNIHGHIHICEAERASIKMLTPQQKSIYHKIKMISESFMYV